VHVSPRSSHGLPPRESCKTFEIFQPLLNFHAGGEGTNKQLYDNILSETVVSEQAESTSQPHGSRWISWRDQPQYGGPVYALVAYLVKYSVLHLTTRDSIPQLCGLFHAHEVQTSTEQYMQRCRAVALVQNTMPLYSDFCLKRALLAMPERCT
jgi:hypothetical protein